VGETFVEVVPHAGATRVLQLALDTLPIGITADDWQRMLRNQGVRRGQGPIDFVIHGWSATSGGAANAGRNVAAVYDQQDVTGATVIVVDWPAMQGASLLSIGLAVADRIDWLDSLVGVLAPDDLSVSEDFAQAEANAKITGDIFATVLTGLAALDFDANVAIQAHSLGNHVAMRGITGFEDPTERFAVDYTAIQPAVPDAVAADPAYAGILGRRVGHLTVTINNADVALLAYEVQGPHPLGAETPAGEGIGAVVAARNTARLGTEVVNHHSRDGNGHLAIDPTKSPLVHVLDHETVQRITGGGTQYADARRHLFATFGPWDADHALHKPGVLEYIEERRRAGQPIDGALLAGMGRPYAGPGIRQLPAPL